MTNAEKYRLSGIEAYELSRELGEYLTIEKKAEGVFVSDINSFFAKATKSTLTEDEKVILRYIDGEYTHIQRADGLWLIHYEDEYMVHQMPFEMYSHLFQFIKNGEEYSIEELLK